MKHLSRVVAATVATLTVIAGVSACGSQSADDADKGHVYFLQNKTEILDQLQKLADDYTDQTGVKVEVSTAADAQFDTTLSSELAKSNAPTMFTIADYSKFAQYQKYMLPVQDTAVYKLLNDDGKAASFTIDKDAYTLPYAEEWSGIIYNKKILREYAKKDYAVIKSADDIKDYDTLKKVAESIQKHKADLDLDGAFATPGLDPSDTFRFGDHMMRPLLFQTFRQDNTTFEPEFKDTFIKNYKDLWDLEMNNNPTEPGMLSSKAYTDVVSEFATARVAFLPNGVWGYADIQGNNVDDKDLGMLPYWMGISGETDYAPPSSYAQWAVNKNAPKKDQQATLDFIKWMVSSDEGREVMSKEMNFAVPFSTFGEADQPSNPLVTAAKQWAKEGKKPLASTPIPGQQYADGISNALMEYAQGTGKWDAVEKAMTDGWTTEWKNFQTGTGLLPDAKTLS